MMIEISMIRDLVAIFGVLAGFSYYVLTVQTQKKNQKLSTTYNIWNVYNDEEAYLRWLKAMQIEWESVEEFMTKYWDDIELEGKIGTMFQFYDTMGHMWKNGVLDLKEHASLYGYGR